MESSTRLIRLPEVADRVGLSKREVYRRIQQGRFPRGRRISHKVSVWIEADVTAWIADTLDTGNEDGTFLR